MAWERARSNHDPLLAPHGMFRSLQPGNNLHAKEFLETFGPLVTRSVPVKYLEYGVGVRIDLPQFWNFQEHFRQFVNLYELRNSPTELPLAIRSVFERRPLYPVVRLFCESHLGLRDVGKNFEQSAKNWKSESKRLHHRYPHAKTMRDLIAALMAEHEEEPTDTAENTRQIVRSERRVSDGNIESLPFDLNDFLPSPDENQRDIAMWLLSLELNQVGGGIKARWKSEGEAINLRISQPTSLWEMIWQLFAADTSGVSWRVCPHCQRLFYPARVDRYYCTSRQQVLESKREWARRRRASRDRPHPTKKEAQR